MSVIKVYEAIKQVNDSTKTLGTFRFLIYSSALNYTKSVWQNPKCEEQFPVGVLSAIQTKRSSDKWKRLEYEFEMFFIFKEAFNTHNVVGGEKYSDLQLVTKFEGIVLSFFDEIRGGVILKDFQMELQPQTVSNGNFLIETRFTCYVDYNCSFNIEEALTRCCIESSY